MSPHRLLMIDLSGPELSADERAFLKDYKVGGVCLFSRNFQNRYQAAELTSELRELLGEDVLIAADQEGGGVVRALDVPYSPGTMLLGAANDTGLTRNVAAATARGLKAMGLNLNFAPDADVNNNPLNPVIGDRSFGSDPRRVAEHVVAFVKGMQAEGVAATVKHFPGHGDTATDSHMALPKLDVSLERLHATELVPFKAAVVAGVDCVMSYHGLVTALDAENPATLSRATMTDFLRGELGFTGVTFTDALEMQAIAARFSPAESVVRALAAGIDMPLFDVHTGPVSTQEEILRGVDAALAEGRLNPHELEQKLARIERLAKRYPAAPNPDAAWQEGDTDLLEEASRRAVTPLGAFQPLDKGQKLVLVAANNTVGGAASDKMSSPAEGLTAALEAKNFKVVRAFYNREMLAETKRAVLQAAEERAVLFVSTSRTRMSDEEKGFVLEVANRAKSFLHVDLWNPYHVLDLPGPALVTFGFREPSVRAAAEVLAGGEVWGQSPVELETA